jgi:hypothetical protein
MILHTRISHFSNTCPSQHTLLRMHNVIIFNEQQKLGSSNSRGTERKNKTLNFIRKVGHGFVHDCTAVSTISAKRRRCEVQLDDCSNNLVHPVDKDRGVQDLATPSFGRHYVFFRHILQRQPHSISSRDEISRCRTSYDGDPHVPVPWNTFRCAVRTAQ